MAMWFNFNKECSNHISLCMQYAIAKQKVKLSSKVWANMSENTLKETKISKNYDPGKANFILFYFSIIIIIIIIIVFRKSIIILNNNNNINIILIILIILSLLILLIIFSLIVWIKLILSINNYINYYNIEKSIIININNIFIIISKNSLQFVWKTHLTHKLCF